MTTDRSFFLEAAQRIGRRIAAQARWDGARCTWPVLSIADGSTIDAPGTVYQGTAGIALFLAELYGHTQDEAVGRAALGGLTDALAQAEALPASSIGFFTGRSGIAYAALRGAALLHQPALTEQAEALVQPLGEGAPDLWHMDVVGGCAGAIPALLYLAEALGDDRLTGTAIALGDRILHAAHREPTGWSWHTQHPRARNLAGMAHGASGIGYALLELYHATGRDGFLFAAEQAFGYERHLFDADAANWPDLRHRKPLESLLSGTLDDEDAIEAILDDAATPYAPRFISAWCHGAPGIGLARLRAYEVLGTAVYRHEAEAALHTTHASLGLQGWNYSLCHGFAGNSETLLYGAEVLGEPRLRAAAEACGRLGWETYEAAGQPWPCGNHGFAPDPSLMQGEAGIGYFFLRLYAPETPSLLLLRAPGNLASDAAPTPTYHELQQAYRDGFFGRTLRIIQALPAVDPDGFPTPPGETASGASVVMQTYAQVQALIARQPEPVRAMLDDAFLPEKRRYALSLALDDYTWEVVAQLRRRKQGEPAWDTAALRRTEHAHLVSCRWDWDDWLKQPPSERNHPPEPSPVFFLLFRARDTIHLRRVGRLTALVLHALEHPATLDALTDRLAASSGNTLDRPALKNAIEAILKQAYASGLIGLESEHEAVGAAL